MPNPMRNLARLTTTPIFSFQPPNHLDHVYDTNEDDESSSPRTKVTQRFRNLTLVEDDDKKEKRELESGGGVTKLATKTNTKPKTNVNKNNPSLVNFNSSPGPTCNTLNFSPASSKSEPLLPIVAPDVDVSNDNSKNTTQDTTTTMEFHGGDMQIDDEDDGAMRKRIKCDGEQDLPLPFPHPHPHPHPHSFPQFGIPDIGTGPKGETSANATVPFQKAEYALPAPMQDIIDPAVAKISRSGASGRLQKSYPSISRLQDSKSRGRKRAGTPPATRRKNTEKKVEDEPEVIDPIRAALTWHEDEITVYDPEDKDDDRRGMDGIGFRPTPAIAYQREQMRRRQLADYKRREENDARARRNQRRREQLGSGVGGGGGISDMERKHSMVRVRFSDGEPASVVTN